MLRSLTLWHIDRVLLGAERALRRRSALGAAEAGDDEALNAVTEFRASLAAPSKALRLGALAVATVVLAHVLATLLEHLAEHNVGATVPQSARINQLLDSTLSTLQLTAGSLDQVIDALLQVSVSVLVVSFVLVSLALYVIVWPVASAFRLKRILFNLYPDSCVKMASSPASWSVTRAEGVYTLEREAFAVLGARVPDEPPLDLLVSALGPACYSACCVYAIFLDYGPSLLEFFYLLAAGVLLYLPPAIIRLAWLAAAWRARTGGPRSTWLFGGEVTVGWRTTPVRYRSPLLIGWLSMWLFPYNCLFFWWPWWSTARDLRDLGRAYDVRGLRRIHPWLLALAAGPGIVACLLPFLIVSFRAPFLVRRAQLAAGLDRPVSRRVALLTLIWPVQYVVLQRELNRLWHSEAARSA